MTKIWMKFLFKLDVKIRFKLEVIVTKILNNDFDGLNIQPLLGKKGYFKIRVGKIRIIFIKTKEENIIDNIGYRGNIYKGL